MVHVEDGGFMKVGETDPCIKLWPHTVPLLMACFGLLSHVPVGRTGDPVLEHQLVAGIGTLGMLIGNIAWYVLASATARCKELVGHELDRSFPLHAHNWTLSDASGGALFEHDETSKLWHVHTDYTFVILLVVTFVVGFKMHTMCFPCWMRVLTAGGLFANAVATQNLTVYDKTLEDLCMLTDLLAAELVGRHFQRAMRGRFVEKRRPCGRVVMASMRFGTAPARVGPPCN